MAKPPANPLAPTTRVLLALTDPGCRRAVRRALTRDGHMVLACRGDNRGLGAPGVVVGDWPLPAALARTWSPSEGIPFVAVVAAGDRAGAMDALRAGATDCVLGPARPADVCLRVAAILGRMPAAEHADPEPESCAEGSSGARLLDALPAGLAVLGPEGSVWQVNAALCRLTGRDRERLLGVQIGRADLFGPDLARVEALFRRARSGGQAADHLEMRTAGGDRPVAVSVTATRDDTGTVSAYVMSVRSPSDRESIEEALGRLAKAVAAADADVMGTIACEAAGLVDAETGVLVRATDDGPVVVGSWGVAAPSVGTHLGPGDPRRAIAAVVRPDGGSAAVAVVPLYVAGRRWGRLAVAGSRHQGHDARMRLERFAQVAAMAAADAEGRDGVAAVERDALTGLLTHSAFFARLGREIRSAARERRPLCLTVVDIDGLKRVNDLHGHPVGDRVVAEVARRLREAGGPAHVVGRLGGEEFGWLMPSQDLARALAVVRGAVRAVSGRTFGTAGRLTASFGVAAFSGTPGETPEDLHRQAEVALHWAKISGGDRCAAYSFEIAEEVFARQAAMPAEAPSLRAMRALAWAVDARDPHTHRHSARVADLSVRIASALGWTVERATQLREAGLVHDVGKIAVPDAILFKPGRLTAAEYEVVKRHAAVGAQIVADVLSAEQAAWVRSHHERWDGRGYPDGLAGEEIPEEARVLALADAWDVMVSARSYKAPITLEAALDEVRGCAGTQFWPDAVGALARLLEAGVLGAEAEDEDEVPPILEAARLATA